MDRLLDFFLDNLPTPRQLLLAGPPLLAWSFASLWLAGRLKRTGVKTGYTRKVFHFLVFGTAAVAQWQGGPQAVCLFGAMCTGAIGVALWQGEGTLLYEAIARERDAPHRTWFVVIPYVTTLVGGVATNILFGPIAVAGYLVTGLGDAIGEPAGTRFGRHRYPVWSLSSVPTTRSVEGSVAVFVMAVIALALAAGMLPAVSLSGAGWITLLVIALASTLAEALTPHGWDNATMQVVPSWLVWWWLT